MSVVAGDDLFKDDADDGLEAEEEGAASNGSSASGAAGQADHAHVPPPPQAPTHDDAGASPEAR
eukprot:5120335-Prorocentrum_lima.AAC.1